MDIVVSLAPLNKARRRAALNQRRIERQLRRGGQVVRVRTGRLVANTTIPMKGPVVPSDTVTIDPIPNIFINVGQDFDMSQYINDPQNLRTTSRVVGLSGNASYDPVSELLTGVSDGTETNLTFEVDF